MTPFVLVDERGLCVTGKDEEIEMDQPMPRFQAHPTLGEEVVAMDDVDVNVGSVSINSTFNLTERVGKHE
jgi:hypothetical protein